MSVEITPLPGHNYQGRQYGFMIVVDGQPYLQCVTGGTGACWNFLLEGSEQDEMMTHVCDLDQLIEALTALRDSDAHKAHKERWGA